MTMMIQSLTQLEFRKLQIDIVEPNIYLDETEDGWSWELAFPPTTTEPSTEDVSGSPVNIEELMIHISNPHIWMNQEEPI